MDNVDYYAVLGVAPNANLETITSAFRRLAHQYHPDRNRSVDATSRMQEINEAYSILRDPDKRAEYDFIRQELIAEELWHAEERRRAEAARQAETIRRAEERRRAEATRQAEAARHAEEVRQAEAAQRESELAFWRELAERKHQQALHEAQRRALFRKLLVVITVTLLAAIITLTTLLLYLTPTEPDFAQSGVPFESLTVPLPSTTTPHDMQATSTVTPTLISPYMTMTAAVATLSQVTHVVPSFWTSTPAPTPLGQDNAVIGLLYIPSITTVRTCPHTGCSILRQLQSGTYIDINARVDGERVQATNPYWYRVEFKGQRGYVYSGDVE